MPRFDVIVVGLGAAGSAALARLARRGVRVLGIDRFNVPHAHGSSHGFTRLVRLAYFEHPDYVPLLRRAQVLWRELETLSSRSLLHLTGAIYVGRPDGELIRGSLAAAREHGLEHELLDRDELARRYPQLRAQEDEVAFAERAAGYVLCEPAIAAQVDIALRHGAVVRTSEPVVRWSADAHGVQVQTAAGRFDAERLIVASGAWTSVLLPNLGWNLTVTRQVMAWVWPKRPERFALGTWPCWVVERRERRDGQEIVDGVHYGFPIAADGSTGLGMKLALHRAGAVVDPERVDRTVDPGETAALREFLRRTIPDADGDVVSLRTCLYTNAPDGHFVIDRHPEHERVIVASPCSGHGFKFAPAIGEALADLAEHGRTELPIDFLSARRMATTTPC
jgi:sarcosine oxidase